MTDPKPPIASVHQLVFDAKNRAWVCTREYCIFTCTHWDYHRRQAWEPRDMKCPMKASE